MRIDDPAFQDFREDASCLIRPQSLIGEKFVECEPTQPRAASSEPPPPLEQIPDGEPGEGSTCCHWSATARRSTSTWSTTSWRSPIRTALPPHPQRPRRRARGARRGAGRDHRARQPGAARDQRGPRHPRPPEPGARAALRRFRRRARGPGPRASQHRRLHQPVRCGRLRDRRAPRRTRGVVRALPELPARVAFDDGQLDAFSTAATPVFTDLGDAAPSLTRLSRGSGRSPTASTLALTSLGTAAAGSGSNIAASDPVIREVRGLAKPPSRRPPTCASCSRACARRTASATSPSSSSTVPGPSTRFDQYGHFIRGLLPTNNCVDYDVVPAGELQRELRRRDHHRGGRPRA